MASQTSLKLPVIDFTCEDLEPGKSSWNSACKDVLTAFEEYGCFLATFDKISPELSNAVFHQLQKLFDLPTEIKAQNTSEFPYLGYVASNPFAPLNEGMGIMNAENQGAIQSFANLMWPSGDDHFCEILESYVKVASMLEQLVRRMVFEGYGVKYDESNVESTTYLLRFMKYQVPQKNKSNVGLQPHTDKNFITILHQNQVSGLELKAKDGQWCVVEWPPSSIIVVAGDALRAWSNGRTDAPLHKVVMRGNKTRYSLVMASFRKGIIQVPEELVDDKHPLQFKPFDNLDYVRLFSTSEDHQAKDFLKAYCGV